MDSPAPEDPPDSVTSGSFDPYLDPRLPAGRHKLSREVVVRSQRERLLVAMIEGAAELGYPQLSVTEISRRAKVSRKTFYELFGEKEECLLSAYDGIVARFFAEVTGASKVEGIPWEQRVRLGGEAALDFVAANPADAKVCLIEAWTAGPRAMGRYRTALRDLGAYMDAGRKRSARGTELPATVATSVLSGCAFVLSRELLDGRIAELPCLLPSLLYSVLVPYVGRVPALEQCEAARRRLAERGFTAVAWPPAAHRSR